jgi:fibronectin-binding autotransporter adhesin
MKWRRAHCRVSRNPANTNTKVMKKKTLLQHLHTSTIAGALALMAAGPAGAVNTDTWNGGGTPDGNWSNGNNWGGTAPVQFDALFFDSNVQTLSTNNFAAGTMFDNIAFTGAADPFTLSGNALTLVTYTNGIDGTVLSSAVGGNITNSSGNVESIALPLTLSAGKHNIVTGGGGQLNLNGGVTRNTGAVVAFSPNNGNINVTGSLTTNGLNNILGGWAITGNDWASLDGSFNVVPYSSVASYVTISAPGAISSSASANVLFNGTGALTSANGTQINSLNAQEGGASTLAVTGVLRLGAKGGIMRNGAATSTFAVNTGNITTSGSGGEITFADEPFTATANNLTINSVITNDNGNAPVAVIIAGYVAMTGTGSSYSGGTYVTQGRDSANTSTFGTGPVYVFPGGQVFLNSSTTYTNSFYIGGFGSTEGGGFGALRMSSSSRIISGSITLLGDACVGQSGKITGPITGTGGLFIGHGTTASGHGTIQVGGAVANSYTGDTTIGSGQSTLDILQINTGFNNVMPHGAGKGNLILNALSSTVTATFDVDGTTQTINGLTNTATSATFNIVTNSVPATQSTLVVGDNNATSTFGGRLGGYLGINKIGTGTQTLTGANTYSGDTAVNGGTLVFPLGGSIGTSTNLTVNSNATLNVAGICPVTLTGTKTLTSSNGITVVALLGAGTAVTTPTLNALGSSNYITIAQIPAISTYPAQFTAIKYTTTLNGTLNFGLAGALPVSPGAAYAGYVSNNVANNSVDFVVTAGPVSLKWAGFDGTAINTSWDTSTADWKLGNGSLTAYSDGVFANFDDTASTGVVSVNQTVSPAGITVSNNALSYTFGGGSAINGGGVVKQGPGQLILDDSANGFSGGLSILGGTVQVGNNDGNGTLPTGGAITDNGNLTFARSDTLMDTSIISGTGTLTINGSGTVNVGGANTFTGAVTVVQGTLQTGNSSALGTTNGIVTVQSGATLDVSQNAINLGQKRIVVSGTGAGGGGALINSSGSTTFVGPNVARVTLAGDTLVGGSGRFDLRSATTSDSSLSSLSTGGNPYHLTVVTAGPTVAFGLIGCSVDPALGNVDIQSGILSLEAATTGLGNTASNLSIWPSGTLQLFALTNQLNKVITVGGDGSANSVSATSGSSTIIGPMNITNNIIINATPATVTLNLNNNITGVGLITKIGLGLLNFAGNSPTYTGGIVQSAGTVAVSGSLTNTLGVTVNNGKFALNGTLTGAGLTNANNATITGSGTNGGPTDISGFLNPGDTNGVIGTLTLAGLNLESGAQLNYDLGAHIGTGVGGTTNDLIVVNGDLIINGNAININPVGLLKTGAGNPYRLFNYTGNLIVNADLTVTGPQGYNFAVDTNTPGQVNLVASGGPPVWNGGSASDSNWSDPANWGGVTVNSGATLFFAGTTRLNNVNDTGADTSYQDIDFNVDAGPFILNGSPVAMGGNINNTSPNTQTIELGLDYSTSHVLNGSTNAGAAGLIIGGGLTNTASGIPTITLAGNGILTNLMGNTDPTTMTNIISINSNSSWVLTDNPLSAPVTASVQFDVLAGTFSYGSGASAPVLNSSAAANNTRVGVSSNAPATFNMVNGTLNLSARLNTGVSAGAVATINMSGGTLNCSLFQCADGNASALSMENITGGTVNVGLPGRATFFCSSRGTGIVTVATSGVINCGTMDVERGISSSMNSTVNLNAGGTISATSIGTATSSSVATATNDTAIFNFNGGTLAAAGSSTTFFQGRVSGPAIPITAIVKAGGAIIDTSSNNISVLEPLQHDSALGGAKDGGLLKLGVGTLTLTAASTYTGNTVITNGTLAVNGTLGITTVTVATNATLAGTGTLSSNALVNAGGTLAPAGVGTVGTLTVVSNVTLLGVAAMDISATGVTNDVLKAGSITYGGTLTVTNIAGTLAGGTSYKLFNSPSITGTFAVTNLPALNTGLAWVTTNLANGIVSIVATVNTAPTNITTVVSGNLLTLSWPADHTGWRLQVQTNSLATGLGTNWVDVAGATTVNSVNATINPANGTVFYRMVYP